jgi:small subunit ribosomal protein S17e
MGNIRQKYIKRTALELLEKFPNEFNEDFQYNKKKVDMLTDVSTKVMRNRIAGYVTTYYIQLKKRAL